MSENRFDPKKFQDFKFKSQQPLLKVLKENKSVSPININPARTPKQPVKQRSIISVIMNTIILFVAAFFLFVLIRALLFQTFIVASDSMETAFMKADVIIANKLSYGNSTPIWKLASSVFKVPKTPIRADIIIYETGRSPGYNIKRVIGMPGEQIKLRKGVIYINGKPYRSMKFQWKKIKDFGPIKLSANSYFIIGDNIRTSDYNFVMRNKIIGVPLVRVWPPRRIGIIK